MRGLIGSVLVAVLLGGFTEAVAQLPPEILADRYLVQAERLMKEKDHAAALEAMNKIIALQKEHGLKLPGEFHFKYAQVALSAGSLEAAIDSVSKYLVVAGRAGKFYREALELLDQAEKRQAEGTSILPEMVVIPGGSFRMGCVSGLDCQDDEKPVHEVRVASFALSKYEVTFEEYDRFTDATGRQRADDKGWGRGRRPVIYVSWKDAVAYGEWLSSQTGKRYRLPSEAEWEYAARAGSTTKYSWGNEIGHNRANCGGCGSQWDDEKTAPVGSFNPNAWGLHDMHGNLWEWVQDCWNKRYQGAPADGSAWETGDCGRRVLRGGSWNLFPEYLCGAFRYRNTSGSRDYFNGFRVARTLAGGSRRSQGGAGRANERPGTVMMKMGGVPLAPRERRRSATRCRQDFSSPGQNRIGSRREDLVSRANMGMASKLMSGQITLFRVFTSARSPVI